MRHAELRIAPTPATAATSATQASRPSAGLGGGAGFAGLVGEVNDDIAVFIRDGGGSAGTIAALSPEGRLWQARSQAAAVPATVAATVAAPGDPAAAADPSRQAFLDRIAPWAREAGARLGVAPELVSAHAALESGWGQRPLRQAEGASSHNLFGIKAGPLWQGEVADAATTEYAHGAALKTRARFRSYPDQASAFRDYADLLLENPRYRGALGAGNDAQAFAQGLARGGYATDPAYAAKLARLAGQLQKVSE